MIVLEFLAFAIPAAFVVAFVLSGGNTDIPHSPRVGP